MTKYNIIFFISTMIVNMLHIICYKELSNHHSIIINKKNIVVFILISLIIYFNSIYDVGFFKPIVSCLCLLVCFYYFYEDSLNITISYGIISYIIAMVCELFISFLYIIFKIDSLSIINNSIFLKCGLSFFIMGLACLLCKINFFKSLSCKLSSFISKSRSILLMLITFMIVLILLDIKYLDHISTSSYIINIVLLIIFELVISFLIIYEIRSSKEIQKYENLLKFLSKYEKIIDEQRIERHEIHNNLLILKSYKNKNSREYNEILDMLIDNYSKTEDVIKNMYKLPNGIKGIVYYKLMNINKKNIKLNVNISKKINFKIEKNNNKEYVSLCKILGIVLDNAIEACGESKDKILNVEMYSENKKIFLILENSYGGKNVKMNRIKEPRYSTKGNNRGYGLSIANKILSLSECIVMNQYIENHFFITEIEVDN